jgi:hypothetical protein
MLFVVCSVICMVGVYRVFCCGYGDCILVFCVCVCGVLVIVNIGSLVKWWRCDLSVV